MQLAVEVKLLRLAVGVANAIPKLANLFHLQRSRLDVAHVTNNPVVELAMEGAVSLISPAPAHSIGEPGDRAGIRARKAGDDRIDQRAHPFRFGREANESLAYRSVGAFGRGLDCTTAGFAPGRPQANHRPRDLILRQRIEPQTTAARADCRQDLARPMRYDEDQRSLRRLLNHFEQGVGAAAIQILSRIHDHNSPAAKGSGELEDLRSLSHGFD